MADIDRIGRDLAGALASGHMIGEQVTRARQYLDQLNQPLRIAVLGKAGAGKSAVRDLLVGADIAPQGLRLPTVALRHGIGPAITCTLPDGSKTTLESSDPRDITAIKAVFADMELPLPALSKISVLDVAAPADPQALHRASQWAAKRSDMILWCSQSFDGPEQAIWAQIPEPVRQRSVLVITKADELRASGMLDVVLAQADINARHAFAQILVLSTRQARSARAADGSMDKAILRDSGGAALAAAVLKQIASRQDEIAGLAEVLLDQQNRDTVETGPAPATDHAAAKAVCQQAVDRITRDSAALAAQRTDTEDGTKMVLQIAEQLQSLSQFLNDSASRADLDDMCEMAFDAADMVQLMAMEKRGDAAGDAVSLLLQVKYELQGRIAA